MGERVSFVEDYVKTGQVAHDLMAHDASWNAPKERESAVQERDPRRGTSNKCERIVISLLWRLLPDVTFSGKP